jgi:signal transduction histidine kinase/CHASE3 domain sensor protein
MTPDGFSPTAFRRLLTRSVAVPPALLAALALVFLGQVVYLLAAARRVDHNDRTIARANRLLKLLVDGETGLRGYLITGAPLFLEPYHVEERSVAPAFRELRGLVPDDPARLRLLESLEADHDEWRAYARRMVDLRGAGGDFASAVRNGEGKRRMDAMRAQIAAFIEGEEHLRDARSDAVRRATWAVMATCLGLALALGVGLAAFTRRQLDVATASYRRALDQSSRLAHRLEALHQIDQAILRAESLDRLVAGALDRLVRAVPCDRAAVALLDEEIGRATVMAAEPDRGPATVGIVPADELPALAPLRETTTTAVDRVEPADGPGPAWGTIAGDDGRSLSAFALRESGRLRGVLYLSTCQPGAPGEDQQAIGLEVAGQFAIAVQQARLRQELRRHAAELEHRVEERTAQLRETNAALEAFSYTISHDLRAPLRAMEGIAQAIVEDFGDRLGPVGCDYAERVVASARRMDALIQDLLDYSRLSRADLHPQVVDLGACVRDALQSLPEATGTRGADLSTSGPMPRVLAHRPTLVQVVANLVANALKFVAPGVRPRVRLWAEHREGRVRLWVEDNGLGIAPRDRERIFRVFERLHGEEAYPGTGIGLAIVKKGVERMGGRVGVESDPGHGSRFWIELPEDGEPATER